MEQGNIGVMDFHAQAAFEEQKGEREHLARILVGIMAASGR